MTTTYDVLHEVHLKVVQALYYVYGTEGRTERFDWLAELAAHCEDWCLATDPERTKGLIT